MEMARAVEKLPEEETASRGPLRIDRAALPLVSFRRLFVVQPERREK